MSSRAERSDQPDVLVVGGGATGTGIARDLALRGVDVTLAERNGLSAGASGRSHGLLHSGARYAESDPEGARECLEENRILRDIAGAAVRETRGLFVQLADDDPAYFEAKRAACEDVGIPVEVIDGEEARAAVPGLAERVERAMWVPDAVVVPSRLVAANAADAREHGARILPHTPVTSMAVEDGRIESVTLERDGDEETVEPRFVVNATGAHAGRVASMAGITVDMRPTRGVMVSVDYEGLEPVLNRCRDPADGDIVVPHDDEVVLGTTSVQIDDPDDYERADWEVEATVEECATILPAVIEAERVRTWWGVRPLYEPDEAARGGRGISRGFHLLDHADRNEDSSSPALGPDGVENFASIVGGKLTTYRRMAEATADLVCDRLGVDAASVTATTALPGASDPAALDEYVREFDGQGPTDSDLVDGERTE